jgi:hypothetical protein
MGGGVILKLSHPATKALELFSFLAAARPVKKLHVVTFWGLLKIKHDRPFFHEF